VSRDGYDTERCDWLTIHAQVQTRVCADDVIFTIAFLGLGVVASRRYNLKVSVLGFLRPRASSWSVQDGHVWPW
jgi:hypothetical protein